VGDGVHAGGGGEHGRQAQREFGVEQGGPGHQVPAVETELAAVVHDHDAPRATSLPVPAVVGTAISGGTRSVIFGEPPSMVA
jgi:hypothetical protein